MTSAALDLCHDARAYPVLGRVCVPGRRSDRACIRHGHAPADGGSSGRHMLSGNEMTRFIEYAVVAAIVSAALAFMFLSPNETLDLLNEMAQP